MIDAHCHLITESIIQEVFEELKDWDLNENKISKILKPMKESVKNISLAQLKEKWLKTLDENGLDKVVFIPAGPQKPCNREFINFINSSERFAGFTTVDPNKNDAFENFKKDIKAGLKGLKLFPSERGFSVADKKLYPAYEYCNRNNIPVIIHFGVTIGPKSDLRFGNPLELSPVLNIFSDIPFIIAHFGAGFFREALMLTYKKENVYFDTSGTNNWLCYHPGGLNLGDIFKQTLDIVGPKRIIFGTDSILSSSKYRVEILNQQKSILNNFLKSKDVELVMGENAKRVYNL